MGHSSTHSSLGNARPEYSKNEEDQFRRTLTLVLNGINSRMDNIEAIKTRTGSAANFRLQFMLRRSK